MEPSPQRSQPPEITEMPSSSNPISSLNLESPSPRHMVHEVTICRSDDEFLEKYSWTKFNRSNYEVILILDNREINGQMDRQFFSQALSTRGIAVEVRPLHLGDTVWVAKNRITGEEVLLDYLVERKTMADLVASIKDGRYKEQKVIYLWVFFEKYIKLTHCISGNSFVSEGVVLGTLFIWWKTPSSTKRKLLVGLLFNRL
jgi:hypothetical protein